MEILLVTTPDEKKRCRTFLKGSEFERSRLGFPAVYAVSDEGTLVGLLGTVPKRNNLVAGPILIKQTWCDGAMVLPCLVISYEKVLRSAGVKMYSFSLKREQDKFISMTANRAGTRLISVGEKDVWFERSL